MTAIETMKRTLLVTVASLAGGLLAAGIARAQDVAWNSPGPLGAGQRAYVELVFADTQPTGTVQLPRIAGLSVLGAPSESSRISIVNGQRSASVTVRYPVRAEREGQIDLPAFEVSTTDGLQTVRRLSVEVGPAHLSGATPQGNAAGSAAVTTHLVPSTHRPYAGEVFDVDVTVALRDGHRGELLGSPAWGKSGIVAEGWGKGQPTSTTDGSAVRFRTRAVAPQPGSITVGPVQQDVRIETGRTRDWDDFFSMPGLADFFSDAQTTEVTVASDPVQLEVQALPQPAPAGFSGAVGDFTLESNLTPVQPNAGEPVTWTLTLKGTGNWSADVRLPARAIPGDIRTIQPKLHREFKENDLFTGSLSEDVVMIPAQAGEVQLEPVHFVYFSPRTQRYETAIVRPPQLTIAPSTVPMQQAAAVAPPVSVTAPVAAAAAAPLPRDPLNGSDTAWTPLASRNLFALSAGPFIILAAYWLLLALRRARHTDARAAWRTAFAQLRAAITSAREATDAAQRSKALLEWQRAAAVILDLRVAAPTPAHVRATRATAGGADTIDAWCELWAASEQALYAREARLEDWWYDQATALCTRARLPRLNPLRAFMPRNLVPAAASAALLFMLATAAPAAPLDAYRQGNFAAAQQELATQAAATPFDWMARYNLGLAHGQLNDNGRALGETAAAFVLQPRNADVRWNLRLFAARVPGVDAALDHIAFAPGAAALARQASPVRWQALFIVACIGLCAGAALILQHRHGGYAGAARVWCSRWLVACGSCGLLAALVALQQYGALANPRAAVVAQASVLRSVPTDAESAPQQAPLAAGTVVVMQKDFLGWVKVARRGGETGWLRQVDLVPLYGAGPGTAGPDTSA